MGRCRRCVRAAGSCWERRQASRHTPRAEIEGDVHITAVAARVGFGEVPHPRPTLTVDPAARQVAGGVPGKVVVTKHNVVAGSLQEAGIRDDQARRAGSGVAPLPYRPDVVLALNVAAANRGRRGNPIISSHVVQLAIVVVRGQIIQHRARDVIEPVVSHQSGLVAIQNLVHIIANFGFGAGSTPDAQFVNLSWV